MIINPINSIDNFYDKEKSNEKNKKKSKNNFNSILKEEEEKILENPSSNKYVGNNFDVFR